MNITMMASRPPPLGRSLSRTEMRTLMHTSPPGGWQREGGNDLTDNGLSVLRHPLRYKEPPPCGLYQRPHPTTWANKVGGAAGLISRHASPKHLPAWRHGRPPPRWWTAHIQQRSIRSVPKASSPEVHRLKETIKAALAKNLNRVIDTFRQWDADLSGKIDKREFFLACTTGLHISAPRQTYDELFDEVDDDRSGEIDYKELNKVLRRRTWDPAFKDQWPGGEGTADAGYDPHRSDQQHSQHLSEYGDSSPYMPSAPARRQRAVAPRASTRATPNMPAHDPHRAASAQPQRTAESDWDSHWAASMRPSSAREGYEGPGSMITMPSGLALTADQYQALLKAAQKGESYGQGPHYRQPGGHNPQANYPARMPGGRVAF